MPPTDGVLIAIWQFCPWDISQSLNSTACATSLPSCNCNPRDSEEDIVEMAMIGMDSDFKQGAKKTDAFRGGLGWGRWLHLKRTG